MTKSKAFPFSEASRTNNPPNLIRWLMILATIGIVGSLAIGLLLKSQSANARANCCDQVSVAAIEADIRL